MARGTPAALSLGPGYLYIAEIGTTEPTDIATPWAAVSSAWKTVGYTDSGSEFKYSLNTDQVQVAEELDPISNPVTGRTSTLTFAMAEVTATNLMRAFNAPSSQVVLSGALSTIEPPDLGTEVRRMIGFDSEDLTERWLFRQCFQTGDTTITRQKGANNATIAVEFTLEKPASGNRLFKVFMTTTGAHPRG